MVRELQKQSEAIHDLRRGREDKEQACSEIIRLNQELHEQLRVSRMDNQALSEMMDSMMQRTGAGDQN